LNVSNWFSEISVSVVRQELVMLRRQALSAISFAVLGGSLLQNQQAAATSIEAVRTGTLFQDALVDFQCVLNSVTSESAAATVSECRALSTAALTRIRKQQPLAASFCQNLADAVVRLSQCAAVGEIQLNGSASDGRRFVQNFHQDLLDKVLVIAKGMAV